MVIFLLFLSEIIIARETFTKENTMDSIRKTSGNLKISPVLEIVPASCIPDKIFYRFLGCKKNKKKEIFDLLSSKKALSVISYSDDKEYYGVYSNRVIYSYSINEKIYLRKIDLHRYDNNIPDAFDCKIALIKKSYIMRLKIYLELCSYKNTFVYGVVAISSIYGIPYNPIGESLVPIRVVDWREFGAG